MDGPTHYAEGEKSFKKAQEAAYNVDGASAVLYMQAAQWHATMAVAAALAELIPPGTTQGYNWRQQLKRPCPAEPESHTTLGQTAGFNTGTEF